MGIENSSILFISHNASRTGAPISLLHIIRFLRPIINANITILLLDGGPLSKDFSELGTVHVMPSFNSKRNLFSRIVERVFSNTKKKRRKLITKLTNYKFDLIYANTAATCEVLLKFLEVKYVPSILHVHELAVMIKLYCGENFFLKAVSKVDKILAVSSLVEEMIHVKYQTPICKIIKVFEPGSISDINSPVDIDLIKKFTVVGCGTLDWRKAPDLFIQIVYLFNKKYPDTNVHFCWVGGDIEANYMKLLQHEIELANLEHKVEFVGEMPNPRIAFEQASVFILTSREDPFPLVCIENAQQGNPIICFKETTGFSEFVNSSNGLVVEFLDISAIVDELHELYSNNVYYNLKSNNIRNLAQQFIPEIVCKPILETVNLLLKR